MRYSLTTPYSPKQRVTKKYDKVGQSRKGAFILSYWLRCIHPRSIEAPFADEIAPLFCLVISIYVLKIGEICPP